MGCTFGPNTYILMAVYAKSFSCFYLCICNYSSADQQTALRSKSGFLMSMVEEVDALGSRKLNGRSSHIHMQKRAHVYRMHKFHTSSQSYLYWQI